MSDEYYPDLRMADLKRRDEYLTLIHESPPGMDWRERARVRSVRSFSLRYPILTETQFRNLRNFWMRHRGPLESFLFADYTDPNAYTGTVGSGDGETTEFWLPMDQVSPGTPLLGNAASFDGVNDAITMTQGLLSAALNGSADISLEAWIRPAAFGGNRAMMDEKIRGTAIVGVPGLAMWLFGNNIGIGGRSVFTDGFNFHTGAVNLSVAIWYHVIGILDFVGNTIYLYINGSADGSSPAPFANPAYTDSGVHHANQLDSLGAFYLNGGLLLDYDGAIDEARIYNRALTGAEIAEHYNDLSVIYVDGLADSDAALTPTTGRIVFPTAPADGAAITYLVYDPAYRVRFALDQFPANRHKFRAWGNQVVLRQAREA